MPLTADDHERCEAFARLVYSTNYDKFEARGQSDAERSIDQIRHGKLAELAVERMYVDLGARIDQPVSFQVEAIAAKSFGADLVVNRLPVHVKSVQHHLVERYGASWVFDARDPLLHRAGHRIAFCVVGPDWCDVRKPVPSEWLVELKLLDEPKVERLRGAKKVVTEVGLAVAETFGPRLVRRGFWETDASRQR